MTLKESLCHAIETLSAGKIEDAPLESELLLRHTLKISRTQLYLSLDDELSPEHEETFWQLVERRLTGEPTAYITQQREFYGLDFYVDDRVLIPRPESEILVERALNYAQNHLVSTIADVGTGCGAVAISLAINLPHIKIYATDVSSSALEVARYNSHKHGTTKQIRFLHGDMLSPIPKPVDLIVANLPYVKESELAQTGLDNFEPRLALNGGPDGLEKICQLSQQASDKLNPDGCLILEIGLGQGEAVASSLRNSYPSGRIEVIPDLSGIDRVISLALSIPIREQAKN